MLSFSLLLWLVEEEWVRCCRCLWLVWWSRWWCSSGWWRRSWQLMLIVAWYYWPSGVEASGSCMIVMLDGIHTRANLSWSYLINASVFSEASWYYCSEPIMLFVPLREVYLRVRPQGGRAPFIIVKWILPIKVLAFWDLTCTDCLDLTFYCGRFFARAWPEHCLDLYILICQVGTNRFSFKRAFEWLSYCILVEFRPLMWNSGCGGGFGPADPFLALFLTQLIGRKSIKQAHYTPNR